MKERIETLKEDQFQNEFQKNLNRFRSWQVEIGILRQMKPCGQVETSTASIYQISQQKMYDNNDNDDVNHNGNDNDNDNDDNDNDNDNDKK